MSMVNKEARGSTLQNQDSFKNFHLEIKKKEEVWDPRTGRGCGTMCIYLSCSSAAHLHGARCARLSHSHINGQCSYEIRVMTNAVLQASFLTIRRCRAPMVLAFQDSRRVLEISFDAVSAITATNSASEHDK